MKKGMMVAMMSLMSALAMSQEASPAAAQDASSAKISLADARGQIDKVVASPEQMKETMKQLSAEDQKAFLAEVNKAVSEMPGSTEEKTALFLNLNLAAMAGAEKGNSSALLAEVFATVPPESLSVLSERFSEDLLSRTEGSNAQVTDAQFETIAVDTVKKVSDRCESTDNGSTRTTFAILMFLRASGAPSESLENNLIDTLQHDDAKEMARTEWIPSALGKDGREQSYDSILASADAGRRPDPDAVLVIAGPQFSTAVLMDLGGKSTERDMLSQSMTPVLDATENVLAQQAPNIGNDKLGGAGASGGAVHGGVIEGGGLGGGSGTSDTRPNPTNPDPQGTGNTPIPYPFQTGSN